MGATLPQLVTVAFYLRRKRPGGEMVDTVDSKSIAFWRGGSIPLQGSKRENKNGSLPHLFKTCYPSPKLRFGDKPQKNVLGTDPFEKKRSNKTLELAPLSF